MLKIIFCWIVFFLSCSQPLLSQVHVRVNGSIQLPISDNVKLYTSIKKKLVPLKLKNGNFYFEHILDTLEGFEINNLVLSKYSLKNFDDYLSAIDKGRLVSGVDYLSYIIDTTDVELIINSNKELITIGGVSSKQYLKSEQIDLAYFKQVSERKKSIEELNIWRMEEILKLVNQYPASKYSFLLLKKCMIAYEPSIVQKIEDLFPILEKYHSKTKIAKIKEQLGLFVKRNNLKKNFPLNFPKIDLYSFSDNYFDNGLLNNLNADYLIIDLWATWCAPCKVQQPLFIKLSKKFKANNNIQFITISIDDKIEKVKEFHIKSPITLNSYWIDYSKPSNRRLINETLGIMSIPKYLILDKKKSLVLDIVSFDKLEERIGALIK